MLASMAGSLAVCHSRKREYNGLWGYVSAGVAGALCRIPYSEDSGDSMKGERRKQHEKYALLRHDSLLFYCFFLQAFAGGCVHGWWNGGALAMRYPPHQRSMVRLRAGAGGGLRIATFALIFEG